MTPAPSSEPAGADADHLERQLHEAWELTRRGFIVGEPVTAGTCQCFFSLRGACCEMDLLAARGMAAHLVQVPYDEICTEIMITNPAEPARGHARISDEGNIRWECFFASPGSAAGLAPPGIARAIATALAGPGTSGHHGPQAADLAGR